MLYGRTDELNKLNDYYNGVGNSLIMLYGRSNIGKTALLREFIKDKKAFYYNAALASEKEQAELLAMHMNRAGLITDYEMHGLMELSDDVSIIYTHLFKSTAKLQGDTKVVIIEEFQNIVKNSDAFMPVIDELVKGSLYGEKVVVIVTSSSVSWIENSMVSAIGRYALSISTFIKLKELSFVDIVRMFPKHSVLDAMAIYAVTGGVPGYLAQFSAGKSLKDNIVQNVLNNGRMLRTAGSDYIKEELRETSLYNTILYCIAQGENKLNELHVHTGFGRDKISVYLKNLIDREVVEKIYSYDKGGKEYTRKGLYRIKSGYTEFWFKFIYPNESQLEIMDSADFYDEYVRPYIYDYAKEAFVRVATEFIELLDSMNRLEIKISRRGRWWGKNGDIDIIACDNEDRYLVGKCNWENDVFSFSMFEEFMLNVNQAGIGKDYIYLFSKDTFDGELKNFAVDNDNVKLISLKDL